MKLCDAQLFAVLLRQEGLETKVTGLSVESRIEILQSSSTIIALWLELKLKDSHSFHLSPYVSFLYRHSKPLLQNHSD